MTCHGLQRKGGGGSDVARTATETMELARKEKCFYGILQPHGRQYTETTEELTGSRMTTEPNQNQHKNKVPVNRRFHSRAPCFAS